jgi:thiol:disulfide interchange protein DsbD
MKRVLFFLAALLPAAPAWAQDAPKVHARLVAEDHAIAPGGTITVALEEKIAPGWHTYWKNPGDAGAPSDIQWTLPPGWKAGAIQWPRPKRLPVGPLMDYGYEGTPWLLTTLTAPADAKGPVTLSAHASWLVCQQICVPEDATLTLNLPVCAQTPNPAVAKDFAAARALLPVASPWKLTYALGNTLDVYVAAPALAAAHPKSADFFPATSGIIKNAAPQLVGYAKDGLVLRLAPGAAVKGPLSGLLVLTSTDGSTQALDVTVPQGVVPPAEFSNSDSGDLSLWLALVFAFAGGLILNVMPCVLPILAMKALSLATHGKEGRGESFAYAIGAVLSFAVLGLAIVLLRQGGQSVGWGFQLQSPIAVAGFALLVFAVALNLSGLFEVGSITAGESLTQKSGFTGAFFTGVLAVAVAAPCTAPFMAAALGFALAQSALLALAVFVSLGLGFALPFLLLGVWPRALAFIPKPGPWMLTFKQFLAFPMYGAAAWLVWVLAQEAGARSVAIILAAFIALALAAWLWSVTRNSTGSGRIAGIVAALLVLLGGLYSVSLLRDASAAPTAVAATRSGEPYTAAKLASLRASGRPVFVDATAAWCITCLVNEDAVLSRPSVKNAFAGKNVAYLVADWTNQNPEITQLLKDNGRSGVPLYLYYAPGATTPVILPQILTENGVLGAIGG